MTKLRLGFIGVGNIGQCAHLRNYATLPDCEVVALAELRPQLAQRVASTYGVPRVYADHRQLLAHEKLDALIHIQNFTFHGQLLPEIYAAGLPVLTEKPLASSVPIGQQLLHALAATRATHYVAYNKRSDPAIMWAVRQIAAWRATNEVVALRYIRITTPPGEWIGGGLTHLLTSAEPIPPRTSDPRPPHTDEAHHRRYVNLANYYVHQVNLLRHLLGGDYAVTFADPNGRLLVARGADANQHVTCTIEMAPYHTTVAWQEEAFVCFDKGWIRIRLPRALAVDEAAQVAIYTDPGNGVTPTLTQPEMPKLHSMRAQAINFLKILRGEPTPLCTAAEALQDLEILHDYLHLYKQAGGQLN